MIAGERVANGLWQHIRLPLRRFLSLPSAGTHLTHTPQPATLSSNTSSLSDPRSLPLTTRPRPTLSPTPCDADNTQTQTPLSVYLTRTTQGLIHTATPPPPLHSHPLVQHSTAILSLSTVMWGNIVWQQHDTMRKRQRNRAADRE